MGFGSSGLGLSAVVGTGSAASALCSAAIFPPSIPESSAFTSRPIPWEIPSVIWVVPLMMSCSSLALLPSPYMVILSTLDRGSATFLAISGRAFITISMTAAWPYFFMASAFLSMPSASARALAWMAAASALPTAEMPAASCSLANRAASACFLTASASCSCSYRLASASFCRWNRTAWASCSFR